MSTSETLTKPKRAPFTIAEMERVVKHLQEEKYSFHFYSWSFSEKHTVSISKSTDKCKIEVQGDGLTITEAMADALGRFPFTFNYEVYKT